MPFSLFFIFIPFGVLKMALCRLHNQDQRIRIGINIYILTKDLRILKEGISMS
jgi:hypothetical protein